MKASEVIEVLKLAIAQHGDLEVTVQADGQLAGLYDDMLGLDPEYPRQLVFYEDRIPAGAILVTRP